MFIVVTEIRLGTTTSATGGSNGSSQSVWVLVTHVGQNIADLYHNSSTRCCFKRFRDPRTTQ